MQEQVKASVGVEHLEIYLPETNISQADYSYLDSVTPENLPLPRRLPRIEGDDVAELLAERIVANALTASGIAAGDIDYLITSNLGGKYVLPGVASHVHRSFPFRREIPAVNIGTGCASWVDSLNLARGLVGAGLARRALVVSCCAETHNALDLTDFMVRTSAHGSCAAIVSAEPTVRWEILSYSAQTYGEIYDQMVTKLGRSAHPELARSPDDVFKVNFYLQKEFYSDAGNPPGALPDGITNAARLAGVDPAAISCVALHQPLPAIHEAWVESGGSIGLGAERFRVSWLHYGNIGSVDVAVNWREADAEGMINEGDIVALFSPGLGGHIPTMLIRKRAN